MCSKLRNGAKHRGEEENMVLSCTNTHIQPYISGADGENMYILSVHVVNECILIR